MKLFLDTADLNEIKTAVSWDIIDGVTTNPSLIKKAVVSMKKQGVDINMTNYIKTILATAGRMCPVSLEVPGLKADEMIAQGKLLFEKFDQVAGNVVIKIPVCTVNSKGEGDPFDGLTTIKALSEEKIPVNATLIFTPEQALLAAKAGAQYVSPFAGRVDDRIRKAEGLSFDKSDYFPYCGMNDKEFPHKIATYYGLMSGVDLVAKIREIFKIYSVKCEIIAASIRNPIQIRECALAGADIATIPFGVLTAMVQNPGTQDGIDAFVSDLVGEYTALFPEPKKQ